MILPEELNSEKNLDPRMMEKMEREIDKSIREFHNWYQWEMAIIEGEYPLDIRNVMAKKYHDAGWKYVYHQTSSENGERPGLTCFKFSMKPLDLPKFHSL